MPFNVTLLCDEWLSTKGGISTLNRELAKELSKFPDLSVSLFMPECKKNERELLEKYDIQVFEARRSSENWWTTPPSDLSPDFVIGHAVVLGKAAPDLKKNYQCKWIQVVHHDPEEIGNYKDGRGARKKAEHSWNKEVALCEEADLVVAVGPKLAECYSNELRHKKVFTLTPAIFEEFSKINQDPNWKEEQFRVLMFGRGEDFKGKGYDIAAKAIAKLNDKSYKLIFVGADDESRDGIRKMLLDHGLSQNQLTVQEFKDREGLAKTFHKVDLVLMPSRSEGFGLSALEALSAGLPILVSSDSGLGEALKEVPGGSSCVVKPEANANDDVVIEEWRKKIRNVRHEIKRRARLKQADNLRKDYNEEYLWAEQCKKLKEVMLSLNCSSVCDNNEGTFGPEGAGAVHSSASTPRLYDNNEDTFGPKGAGAAHSSASTSQCHRQEVREVLAGSENNNCTSSKKRRVYDNNEGTFGPKGAGAAHSSASTPQLLFKQGTPPDVELDELAGKIVPVWQKLGIRLNIPQYKLDEIAHKEKDPEYKMLIHWKKTFTSSATYMYEALYYALCHERVSCNDVAKGFCCLKRL